MAIQVERESISTKSQFVTPTYTDKDGLQQVIGSDRPAPILDVNHLRLHEGRAYYVYYMNLTLGVVGNLDIAIAFPSGITPHAIFNYQSGGSAVFKIYEAPTTSLGTALTIHRRNRNLETTSAGAAVHAPIVTALGTEIFGDIITSGTGGTGAGGGGYTYEYILKPLTTYLFRLTNTAVQTNPAELLIEWYE